MADGNVVSAMREVLQVRKMDELSDGCGHGQLAGRRIVLAMRSEVQVPLLLNAMIMTIDQSGNIQFIGHDGHWLADLGEMRLRRASYIEPYSLPLRLLFHCIRACVRDDSRFAAWTRSWRCLWRVRIIGGPVLAGEWRDRAEAIRAEVAWLEKHRFGD